MDKALKLTAKQKLIVFYMQEGYSLMIGQSETSRSIYYMIAGTHNKGYGNTYFRSDCFGGLLNKNLIRQQNRHPFDYILTELGESIIFKKSPIK